MSARSCSGVDVGVLGEEALPYALWVVGAGCGDSGGRICDGLEKCPWAGNLPRLSAGLSLFESGAGDLGPPLVAAILGFERDNGLMNAGVGDVSGTG